MRPTDDTIALVAFLMGGDWWAAEDLREGIAKLGFRRPPTQWLVSRLIAMCKESAPRFERRTVPYGPSDYRAKYRVTSWAATGLGNQWRGFDGFRAGRAHPTPQPEHLREETDHAH